MSARTSGKRSSRLAEVIGWNSSDYSINKGFPEGTNYLRPDLVFNSDLAINGDLFKPFGPVSSKKYTPSSIEIPPLPGHYPYDKGWEAWGGDSKYLIGDTHYGNFISSFGLVSATSVHAYYASDGQIKSAKRKLARLAKGSVDSMNWFAGLADGKGNKIKYNPKSKAGMIKSMISMLINGDQPIDLEMMFDQLNQFITSSSNKESIGELKGCIKSLREYLARVSFGRIEVIPWQELVNRRRKGMLYMYGWYKSYRSDPRKYGKTISGYIQDFIDTANQMAMLFAIICHVSLMFDCLLDQIGRDGPVIPQDKRSTILENITNQLLDLFMVNTIIYRDLAELYTRNDDEATDELILQAEITHVDQCDKLSELLGLVLAILHALVAGRDMYSAF